MVIAKSLPRFARNTLDTLKYVRMLKEKGIAVYFEVEKITDIPDIPILSGKEAIRRKDGARQSGKVHA